ncbi:MAG: glycogen debranching enzyme family protein [Chloroflexi bacterium]|nr:glycogen debranching enzyme family protein [Chloroflexota bacterium]
MADRCLADVANRARPRSSSEPVVPTFVRVGRGICGDLEATTRREWLVTNGLGGYAFGTVAGIPTRGYHGLLVAALSPPVGRTVLVAGLLEWVSDGRERVPLHTLERDDRSLDGDGYRRLGSVRSEGMLPVFRYRVGDVVVEKRIWMAYGANTTYVRYELVEGSPGSLELELTPLVTGRDHHRLGSADDGAPMVTTGPDGAVVARPAGCDVSIGLRADGAMFRGAGRWIKGLRHREESARGLADRSDAFAIGTFRGTIGAGRPLTLVLTAEPEAPTDPDAALEAARARQVHLVGLAGVAGRSPFVRALVLAADQFIVDRRMPGAPPGEPGRTIVAGYPWFNDWGRDTMIALPGLCLATGRHEEAATILRSFARFVRDGLLPNDFPDRADGDPAYHTVDASLWFVIAVRAHARAVGHESLVEELLPVLVEILDRHVAGTRFGIALDPADGLLAAGEEGHQLTWMDAKVEGLVVTPRRGKPVEIQALWVNALRIVAAWLVSRGDPGRRGAAYSAIAERATRSFVTRFWDPARGHLLDVVDSPDGDDPSLRPNQLFALSLPHPLVGGEVARACLAAVRRSLAMPLGLRTLASTDQRYRSRFQGDRRSRDLAYHQGTIWTWPIGAYAEAIDRVDGDRAAALDVLRPFIDHLSDAGLGSISEILEPEPPFEPRGCVAQAWAVAEVLRVWSELCGE